MNMPRYHTRLDVVEMYSCSTRTISSFSGCKRAALQARFKQSIKSLVAQQAAEIISYQVSGMTLPRLVGIHYCICL